MKFIRVQEGDKDILLNPQNVSEVKREGSVVTILYFDNTSSTMTFSTVKQATYYMDSLDNNQEVVIHTYKESFTAFSIFVVGVMGLIIYKSL